MSHITSGETEVRDIACVKAACRRLGLEAPTAGEHHLFSGNVAGLGVKLPGWRYPAVFDIDSGRVRYDNYGGSWGDPAELDKLRQAYAVEKAMQTARASRQRVLGERTLPDGTIELRIAVGS